MSLQPFFASWLGLAFMNPRTYETRAPATYIGAAELWL